MRGAPLPGALLPNTERRSTRRQVNLEVEDAKTAFTNLCAPGETLSIPAKHQTGRFYSPDLDPAQVVLRYASDHNFNGSQDEIAGVRNAAGNVFGLMPHPEHAVDPRTAPSTACASSSRWPRVSLSEAVALGLTEPEYADIVARIGREPEDGGE